MAKFNIINKAENLVAYTLHATDTSPKKLRCDIVPEIRKTCFRILEDIVRANCNSIDGEKSTSKTIQNRLDYQEDALASIRVLEVFIEIANTQKYITDKQLAFISKTTQELYDMIANWNKSDLNRK